MNTSMQVLKVALEVLLVVPPRQPVHAGGGILFEFVERRVEQVDADVVEERNEPLLLPFLYDFRMRSSACDTVARFCARSVLCWLAFPSAPALRSTGSAAVETALFVGFPATMAESDFSRPCIIGYGSSPSRCGPAAFAERPITRSPGSRARSVCTCQGL